MEKDIVLFETEDNEIKLLINGQISRKIREVNGNKKQFSDNQGKGYGGASIVMKRDLHYYSCIRVGGVL